MGFKCMGLAMFVVMTVSIVYLFHWVMQNNADVIRVSSPAEFTTITVTNEPFVNPVAEELKSDQRITVKRSTHDVFSTSQIQPDLNYTKREGFVKGVVTVDDQVTHPASTGKTFKFTEYFAPKINSTVQGKNDVIPIFPSNHSKPEADQTSAFIVTAEKVRDFTNKNVEDTASLPQVMKNCSLDWKHIEELKQILKLYAEVKEKLYVMKHNSLNEFTDFKEANQLLDDLENNITDLLAKGKMSQSMSNGNLYPNTEVSLAKTIEGTTNDNPLYIPTQSSVISNNLNQYSLPAYETNTVESETKPPNKTTAATENKFIKEANKALDERNSHHPEQSIAVTGFGDFSEPNIKLYNDYKLGNQYPNERVLEVTGLKTGNNILTNPLRNIHVSHNVTYDYSGHSNTTNITIVNDGNNGMNKVDETTIRNTQNTTFMNSKGKSPGDTVNDRNAINNASAMIMNSDRVNMKENNLTDLQNQTRGSSTSYTGINKVILLTRKQDANGVTYDINDSNAINNASTMMISPERGNIDGKKATALEISTPRSSLSYTGTNRVIPITKRQELYDTTYDENSYPLSDENNTESENEIFDILETDRPKNMIHTINSESEKPIFFLKSTNSKNDNVYIHENFQPVITKSIFSENDITEIKNTNADFNNEDFISHPNILDPKEHDTIIIDENSDSDDPMFEETNDEIWPNTLNKVEEIQNNIKEPETEGMSINNENSENNDILEVPHSHLTFKSTPPKNIPLSPDQQKTDFNILEQEPIKSRLNVLIDQIIYHPMHDQIDEIINERDYPFLKLKHDPVVENVEKIPCEKPAQTVSESEEYGNMLRAINDVSNKELGARVATHGNKFKREMGAAPSKDKRKVNKKAVNSFEVNTFEDIDESDIENESTPEPVKKSIPSKYSIKSTKKKSQLPTLKKKWKHEEKENVSEEKESPEESEEDRRNHIPSIPKKKMRKSIVPSSLKGKQSPKPLKSNIKSALEKKAKKPAIVIKAAVNSKSPDTNPSEGDLDENGLPEIVYIPFKNSNNLDVKSLLLLSNALSNGDSMSNYLQPEISHYYGPSIVGSNYILPTNTGANNLVPTNPGYVVPTNPGSNYLPVLPEELPYSTVELEPPHHIPYPPASSYSGEVYDPVKLERYWKTKRRASHDEQEDAPQQRKSFFNFEGPTREIANMIKSIQELSKQFKKN